MGDMKHHGITTEKAEHDKDDVINKMKGRKSQQQPAYSLQPRFKPLRRKELFTTTYTAMGNKRCDNSSLMNDVRTYYQHNNEGESDFDDEKESSRYDDVTQNSGNRLFSKLMRKVKLLRCCCGETRSGYDQNSIKKNRKVIDHTTTLPTTYHSYNFGHNNVFDERDDIDSVFGSYSPSLSLLSPLSSRLEDEQRAQLFQNIHEQDNNAITYDDIIEYYTSYRSSGQITNTVPPSSIVNEIETRVPAADVSSKKTKPVVLQSDYELSNTPNNNYCPLQPQTQHGQQTQLNRKIVDKKLQNKQNRPISSTFHRTKISEKRTPTIAGIGEKTAITTHNFVNSDDNNESNDQAKGTGNHYSMTDDDEDDDTNSSSSWALFHSNDFDVVVKLDSSSDDHQPQISQEEVALPFIDATCDNINATVTMRRNKIEDHTQYLKYTDCNGVLTATTTNSASPIVHRELILDPVWLWFDDVDLDSGIIDHHFKPDSKHIDRNKIHLHEDENNTTDICDELLTVDDSEDDDVDNSMKSSEQDEDEEIEIVFFDDDEDEASLFQEDEADVVVADFHPYNDDHCTSNKRQSLAEDYTSYDETETTIATNMKNSFVPPAETIADIITDGSDVDYVDEIASMETATVKSLSFSGSLSIEKTDSVKPTTTTLTTKLSFSNLSSPPPNTTETTTVNNFSWTFLSMLYLLIRNGFIVAPMSSTSASISDSIKAENDDSEDHNSGTCDDDNDCDSVHDGSNSRSNSSNYNSTGTSSIETDSSPKFGPSFVVVSGTFTFAKKMKVEHKNVNVNTSDEDGENESCQNDIWNWTMGRRMVDVDDEAVVEINTATNSNSSFVGLTKNNKTRIEHTLSLASKSRSPSTTDAFNISSTTPTEHSEFSIGAVTVKYSNTSKAKLATRLKRDSKNQNMRQTLARVHSLSSIGKGVHTDDIDNQLQQFKSSPLFRYSTLTSTTTRPVSDVNAVGKSLDSVVKNEEDLTDEPISDIGIICDLSDYDDDSSEKKFIDNGQMSDAQQSMINFTTLGLQGAIPSQSSSPIGQMVRFSLPSQSPPTRLLLKQPSSISTRTDNNEDYCENRFELGSIIRSNLGKGCNLDHNINNDVDFLTHAMVGTPYGPSTLKNNQLEGFVCLQQPQYHVHANPAADAVAIVTMTRLGLKGTISLSGENIRLSPPIPSSSSMSSSSSSTGNSTSTYSLDVSHNGNVNNYSLKDSNGAAMSNIRQTKRVKRKRKSLLDKSDHHHDYQNDATEHNSLLLIAKDATADDDAIYIFGLDEDDD